MSDLDLTIYNRYCEKEISDLKLKVQMEKLQDEKIKKAQFLNLVQMLLDILKKEINNSKESKNE